MKTPPVPQLSSSPDRYVIHMDFSVVPEKSTLQKWPVPKMKERTKAWARLQVYGQIG